MADTERLINKAQGDSIISAIQGITARLQEMYTVDDAMSSSSENPVQNKVITAALDNKVDKVEGKGLSTNDYTNEDKASVANSAEQLESTQTVSGNPLTLTDCAPINAESLVVELEPKQDLHGQSAPYVGGAGKNKLPMTVEGLKASNTDGTWNGNVFTHNNGVTFTVLTDADGNVTGIKANGTASAQTLFIIAMSFSLTYESIINGCPANGSNSTYMLVAQPNADTGSGYTLPANDARNIYINIASGYTANNLIFYPMIRLSTEPDPTFAPYSNICPITGYTECEVDDVGKNKLNLSDYTGNIYAAYGFATTISGEDVTITLTNYPMTGATESFEMLMNTDAIFDKTGLSVKAFISSGDNYVSGVRWSNIQSNNNIAIDLKNLSQGLNATITMRIMVYDTSSGEPTTYEPYQSRTASVTFGQTVYGGRSNFTEGGTSDEFENVDLGDLSWTYRGDGLFSADLSDYAFESDVMAYCSGYRYMGTVDGASMATSNGSVYLYYNDGQSSRVIYVVNTQYTDAIVFKAAVTGIQFVYEKATTTTISTPPTDLKLLKGTNNINTNGTTINLGYQPDNVVGELKGEIEKITVMPYLRILDNDIDTEVKNYRLYYRLISSSYTLVNLAEMLQHRFLFVEIIQNPSGTANHTLLHSALIDPRTIDGFEYQMKAGTGDTVIIESNIAENKFDLSVRYTGTHTSGDPTDYYVTIRMVD